MKLAQIPRDKLIEGRWYLGRGRNGNVARWTRMGTPPMDRFTFLTIGMTFAQGCVKDEGYYGTAEGCFQPFLLIDEGYTLESIGPGDKGWDKHYAKSILWPTPEGDPKEWKEEAPRKPRCHHIWIGDRTEECEGGTRKRYFHTCPKCGKTKVTVKRALV